MRTDAEILARISERSHIDFFAWEANDLIVRLSFDAAKPMLKEDAKPEEWTVKPREREAVLAEMLEYMPFAWDKANEQRGISAGRSMHHYMAWTWLVGDDFGELTDYDHYGKGHLVRICEKYGWDHKQWDDGSRANG